MKRSAFRGTNLPERQIGWRAAEYIASRANAADRSDDRVSENIFDVEDERAVVVMRRVPAAHRQTLHANILSKK